MGPPTDSSDYTSTGWIPFHVSSHKMLSSIGYSKIGCVNKFKTMIHAPKTCHNNKGSTGRPEQMIALLVLEAFCLMRKLASVFSRYFSIIDSYLIEQSLFLL